MEVFYAIIVPTKKGVKRYINLNTSNGIPVLTFDKNEACLWDNEEIASKWAENYFINCEYWKVEEVSKDVNI